jgi:trimeric autotransporter adhesin
MFAPRVLTTRRLKTGIARISAGVALALIVAACGSTTTESVVGPAPAKCGVTLLTAEDPVDGSGGTRTLTVTTTPECAWMAAADVAWISELAPGSGQGNAAVQFRADSNPTATAREGGITVNNQRMIVRQAAASCHARLAIPDVQFAAAGGAATITVTAPGGCAWTLSSSASWIILTPPVSGVGPGTVGLTVAQNTGAARNGTIIVGDADLQLSQASAPGQPAPGQPAPDCGISFQPTSVSMPAAGGGSSVAITTNDGCPWTATSQAPWITIPPPASGSGRGSKAFTVATNTSAIARSGTITIGGATLTVNQAGAPCVPSIDSSSQSMAGPGGTGTPVAVTAATGCVWTSTSNAAWLTITAGASGIGNGTVGFHVAPNTLTSRTGTLTIAGRAFTVDQAACTYEIDRTSQTIGGDGSAGAPITVFTQAGCPWTSTANADWLHITSGASGTGGGSVNFTVDSFGDSFRAGTLTVAGRTFTVNQERCTATLTPENQSLSSSGGSFSVFLATQTGCNWTATSDAVWLTITDDPSGISQKTVNYRVLPNPGGNRVGRLTFVVAGDRETLTVSQGTN